MALSHLKTGSQKIKGSPSLAKASCFWELKEFTKEATLSHNLEVKDGDYLDLLKLKLDQVSPDVDLENSSLARETEDITVEKGRLPIHGSNG